MKLHRLAMYKPRPITLTERELRVLGAMERALADEDPAAVPIAVHFGAAFPGPSDRRGRMDGDDPNGPNRHR